MREKGKNVILTPINSAFLRRGLRVIRVGGAKLGLGAKFPIFG